MRRRNNKTNGTNKVSAVQSSLPEKEAFPTVTNKEALQAWGDAVRPRMGSQGSKHKGGRNAADRRRARDTLDSPSLAVPTAMTVPSGYGILLPKFQATSVSDEDTFIGLGLNFGRFQPLCDNGVGSYANYSDHYAQMVLAQLRDLGYAPTYTVADIRTYMNSVAELHQLHRYVYHIRTLGDHTNVHSARSIATFCSQGISGRLVATQRALGGQLKVLPFPKNFLDALHQGLDITTMSDNPNSPIRMFVPMILKQTDADAVNRVLTASKATSIIDNAINAFFGNATNRELATILPMPGHELAEKANSHITFNNSVVNNMLNTPYYDVSYAPTGAEGVNVNLFARRQLTPMDILTFAPGTGSTHSVWRVAFTLDNHNPLWYVNDLGQLMNAYLDTNAFTNFGTVWENDIAAVPGNSPSITKVAASFEGVAKGIAAQMFGV